MSNLRNLNQPPNPLVDFLSSLENMTSNHPFFAAYNPGASQQARDETSTPSQPHPTEGPSNPPASGTEQPPPPPQGEDPFERGFPFRGRRHSPHGNHGPHPHHHGPPPQCGARARGGFARGGRCGGGPRHGPANGPFGAGAAPWAQNMDFGRLAEMFGSYLGNLNPDHGFKDTNNDGTANHDFTPAADVFDTESAYHVHISLPGAKKQDVGVTWDADNSTLDIAGVVHRPGDEEFLKTLAMGERKNVGVFERKIRLGTKAEPAAIDMEGINAKMEDGVLMVTVPKLDQDFVEVKKVDIE